MSLEFRRVLFRSNNSRSWAGLLGRVGCREKVDPILISTPPQKAVPGAAVVRPVADTDQTLAAVLQLLPSRDDRVLLDVKVEVRLPGIEGVPHIGRGVLERKTQRMRIHELDIAGQILRRAD